MRRLLAALMIAFFALMAGPGATAPKVRTHRVARGNTIGKIAKRYRVTVDALCYANDITKRAKIKIGQKLLVPPRDDEGGKKTRKVHDERRADSKDKADKGKKGKRASKKKAASRASGAPKWHRVYKKQNLGSIARRYNTTVAAIVTANDIKKKERIHPGLMLIIPDRGDKDGTRARKIFDSRDGEPPAEKLKTTKGAASKADASWKKYRKTPKRRGYINIVGRKGRTFKGYLVNGKRHVVTKAKKEMKRVLATSDGKQHKIDLRLLRLLADVSDNFGGRPIKIVSGFRLGSTSATSRHRHGKAIDFIVVGVPNTALRDYVKTRANVGVGYYPNSSFIHMDVRKQWTYWIDYSGPGQRPRYGGFWVRR
jgi:uncharacterized protein YcbK (DUF882 family)/LysM repeat protein